MDEPQALMELIDLVSASPKPIYLDLDDLIKWPDSAVKHFLALGLISKTVNADSITCPGCEHRCSMPIALTEDNQRAFIVCDHPDMQEQMGRINVPMQSLQQWQACFKRFAVVATRLLGVNLEPEYLKDSNTYKLGMLKSQKGRKWALLKTKPLMLETNGRSSPLCDLLYFEDNELRIDREQIDRLLNAESQAQGKAYTPDTTKRETSKLATQARHQSWRDEYKLLQSQQPHKSDSWYSNKISKMDIAEGCSAETIRKNMK